MKVWLLGNGDDIPTNQVVGIGELPAEFVTQLQAGDWVTCKGTPHYWITEDGISLEGSWEIVSREFVWTALKTTPELKLYVKL